MASLQRVFQSRLCKHDLSDPKSSDIVWVDDMTKWAPVHLGKIFSYIPSYKECDSEYIGEYKDEKGYSYWKSNFVGTILYADNKDGKCCSARLLHGSASEMMELSCVLVHMHCWHECNMQPHYCIPLQGGICIHPWLNRAIMYISPLWVECVNQERCATRKNNGHANQKEQENNWK